MVDPSFSDGSFTMQQQLVHFGRWRVSSEPRVVLQSGLMHTLSPAARGDSVCVVGETKRVNTDGSKCDYGV